MKKHVPILCTNRQAALGFWLIQFPLKCRRNSATVQIGPCERKIT